MTECQAGRDPRSNFLGDAGVEIRWPRMLIDSYKTSIKIYKTNIRASVVKKPSLIWTEWREVIQNSDHRIMLLVIFGGGQRGG